jgi:PAS domain S-box-containing protein
MTEHVASVDRELAWLFDASLDALCIAGFDGRFRRVNPAFAEVLGYTQEELRATPFLRVVHEDDRASVEAALGELLSGNDIIGFECRQLCVDGSVRWFEWNTCARPTDGEIYGVGRDVTGRYLADVAFRALHRIATLVAQGAEPLALFTAVVEEVARVVDVPIAAIARYESDGTATECAAISAGTLRETVGTRWSLEGTSVLRQVLESGEPARIDDYSPVDGEIAHFLRRQGVRSSIGIPIVVDGRLWGAMVVSSDDDLLPEETESRLTDFTELLATAIASVESRETLERLADEQASLRRVATLVARAAAPDELFSTVASEVGRLADADLVSVTRFNVDGLATVVGAWSANEGAHPFPVGSQINTGGENAHSMVFETGRAARVDDFGAGAEILPSFGIRSTVVAPIHIEGRVWGAMGVASTRDLLAADTQVWLAGFTELIATAIANADSKSELIATTIASIEAREMSVRLAEQQAALRRIGVSIARGVAPRETFDAVCEEAKRLFGYDLVSIGRFEADDPTIVAVGASLTFQETIPIGTQWDLEDDLATTQVFRTGCAARSNRSEWRALSSPVASSLRQMGVVCAVASPIFVEERLWGAMTVSSQDGPLPPDTEERLESFTDLVATAIANARNREQLAESRRRIVTASDDARRRIERDLHDGTQQRLVSLGLAARSAEALVDPDSEDLRAALSGIATGLAEAVTDLQEISRGIHPEVLSRGGLAPALRTLARRSTIPVDLDASFDNRLAEPIEVAAYFVASEALANAAKHAQASSIEVSLRAREDRLVLSVRDDGVGGADAARGSGLVGLLDRVEALDGVLDIRSEPGCGTRVAAELPLELRRERADAPQSRRTGVRE